MLEAHPISIFVCVPYPLPLHLSQRNGKKKKILPLAVVLCDVTHHPRALLSAMPSDEGKWGAGVC